MSFDDGADDPEPQAKPAGLRLMFGAPAEGSEEAFARWSGRARSLVLHPHRQTPFIRFAADADGAALRRELIGVGEQIDEHLRQPVLVAFHEGQLLGKGDLEPLASQREKRADEGPRILYHLREIDALAPDRELAGLDTHAFEQIIDQLGESQRPALQRLGELPALSGRHALEVVEQQLDRGELRGERRAELVRDVGEYGIAGAAHGLELRLVTDHLDLESFHEPGAGHDGRAYLIAAVQPLHALRVALGARHEDRTAVIAGTTAVLCQRLQHIAAEAADGRLGLNVQQPGGLGIEITDVALLIYRVDPLDDAGEYRLRLGLAPPQCSGQ